MPSEVPASRRSLAIGLFAAIQALAHVAMPVAIVNFAGWDGGIAYVDTTWFVTLGICCGQTTVAAIWVGLGPGSYLWRASATVLVWALSLLWFTGTIVDSSQEFRIAVNALFGVQFFLWQIPSWIARRCWKLRINEPRCRLSNDSQSAQFSLRQLFLGVAGCGCLLGAIRIVLGDFDPNPSVGAWGGVTFCLVNVNSYPLGICMCFAVPVVGSALSRNFTWVWILGLTALLPTFTLIESFNSRCQYGVYLFFPFEQLLWLNSAHSGWLLTNLLLLRLAGFRLERPS